MVPYIAELSVKDLALVSELRERERRVALLDHEVDEIFAAKLRSSEETALDAQLTVARSAEKLRELRRAAELDPRLVAIADCAAAQVSESDDLASELRRYADGVEADPQRLADEERAARDTVAEAARALQDARAKAGAALAVAVEAQLKDLALARCAFSVQLEPREPDASGGDQVRFLIAPNPGETAKPIDEIASGGELSRIMLALEVSLAANDLTPVLVFDEVDAGVGGRVGETLGRALWALARHHQVMVVSHLPQVAAYADQHVSVRKEVRKGRTHVVAQKLDEGESVEELAAMLGAGGARSLAAGAQELRDGANAWRNDGRRTAAKR